MSVPSLLTDDARRIWQAGVAGAAPALLLPEYLAVEGRSLCIGDDVIDLNGVDRIAVVGGGKAAGEMAAAVERQLGPQVAAAKQLHGWVNVPAGSRATMQWIHRHEARPWGVNEPTAAGERGVAEILRIVAQLAPRDLCLCVLTGGASALMPAPIEGLSLADKTELTRELSARGATISELNAVRRELSRIKGGGLASACGAERMYSFILSDVPRDDLEVIASGPTVVRRPTPDAAVHVLAQFGLDATSPGQRALELLRRRKFDARDRTASCRVTNLVIGNNATAVDAAGVEAERLGYSHAMIAANRPEGAAEAMGRQLAAQAVRMRAGEGPDCLIAGGEPTVELAPIESRGLGGRNQQLCLAALAAVDDWRRMALLSGGTDGEDGPTDAAGAWADEHVAAAAERLQLAPTRYLDRNDAYRFFAATGGLLTTGPTGTNVCDLRVVVVDRGRK